MTRLDFNSLLNGNGQTQPFSEGRKPENRPHKVINYIDLLLWEINGISCKRLKSQRAVLDQSAREGQQMQAIPDWYSNALGCEVGIGLQRIHPRLWQWPHRVKRFHGDSKWRLLQRQDSLCFTLDLQVELNRVRLDGVDVWHFDPANN